MDLSCFPLDPLESGENHLPLSRRLRTGLQFGYDFVAELLIVIQGSKVIYSSGIVAVGESFDLQDVILCMHIAP